MSQTMKSVQGYDVEQQVRRRYADGARQAEAELCCPIDYESRYLDLLPREIIEKDYGCGDPSRWVGAGETVLDLGSGAGKICYILATGSRAAVPMTAESRLRRR